MFTKKLVDDMATRIGEVMAMSPARDIEINLKSSLAAWIGKLDLATREEFDVQSALLASAQERLMTLEARIAGLEAANAASSNGSTSPP